MDIKVTIKNPKGSIQAIASKSQAHRHLICSALSGSSNSILIKETSLDIEATVSCLNSLGASIIKTQTGFDVTPITLVNKYAILDCNESGSTFRFMLPITCALHADAIFIMKPGLAKRPITQLYKQLENKGCNMSSEGSVPFITKGQLQPGEFRLPGDISSQYITGLLMALPLLKEQSSILLDSKLESSGYVDITIDVLHKYGIKINRIENGYAIPGKQKYISPKQVEIEKDWSNAAFFLCAGALTTYGITVEGLDVDCYQKDKSILEILKRMGAIVEDSSKQITVKRNILIATDIDASEIPDLVPILSLVASVSEGTTKIFNAKRLRIKESDRLQSTCDMLKALGADIEVEDDSLIINGKNMLSGGTIDSCNDHRIAMTAAISSIVCENPVTIKDAQAVNKSYPSFFEDLAIIGGNIETVSGGNDVFSIR